MIVGFAIVLDGNGEEALNQPYHSALYNTGKEGWIDFWHDDAIGPSKTRRASMIFPVPKRSKAASSSGPMKVFVEQLYVVDLGPPT